MKKIAIVHFSPVERYPPAINWLNFVANCDFASCELRVYTSQPDARTNRVFIPLKGFIRIRRVAKIRKEQRSPVRYWNYFLFYIRTLLDLIFWRPDAVLYYETLSALPALIYKRCFRRRAELYVHYHEYISEQEYEEGIALAKWPHRIERKSYPKFRWISHTNEDRMKMFLKENGNIRADQTYILPNYPPRSWAADKPAGTDSTLRIVYVGAMDLSTMYTRELAGWIAGLGGLVKWDIYSSNITDEAKDYLNSLGCHQIKFMGSVEYAELPGVLRRYDVGVALYKGTTLNYKYNAPNKLYEYWACGLDVWFPEEMDSCHRLVTAGVFPKVMPVDFGKLQQLDPIQAAGRQGLKYAPSPYYAEEVLPLLSNQLGLANLQSGESR